MTEIIDLTAEIIDLTATPSRKRKLPVEPVQGTVGKNWHFPLKSEFSCKNKNKFESFQKYKGHVQNE